MMKDTVTVDGKVYQKTRLFGNRETRVIFKNRKSYTRKSKHKEIYV